jgi:hypothetical protein
VTPPPPPQAVSTAGNNGIPDVGWVRLMSSSDTPPGCTGPRSGTVIVLLLRFFRVEAFPLHEDPDSEPPDRPVFGKPGDQEDEDECE